MQNVRNFKV